jgi:hypothetical protein
MKGPTSNRSAPDNSQTSHFLSRTVHVTLHQFSNLPTAFHDTTNCPWTRNITRGTSHVITEQAGEAATFQARIRQVLGSILGQVGVI